MLSLVKSCFSQITWLKFLHTLSCIQCFELEWGVKGGGGGGGGGGCGSLKWASVVSNIVGTLIWSCAFLKEGANSYIHSFTKKRKKWKVEMEWTEKEGWTVGRETKGKRHVNYGGKNIRTKEKSDEEFWSCLRATSPISSYFLCCTRATNWC